MRFIGSFIIHVFSNVVALLAATYFVAGFVFGGNFVDLFIAALVLTLINAVIRPILKLFLGPFIVLTFGLFVLVINAVMLYLLDIWSAPLTIEGYIALFWATLIVTIVNLVINLAGKWFYKK